MTLILNSGIGNFENFCIDHKGHSKEIPRVKIFLGFGLKIENFCCLKRLYSAPKHERFVVRTYFCESDIFWLLIMTVKSYKWWESQMFPIVIPYLRLCVWADWAFGRLPMYFFKGRNRSKFFFKGRKILIDDDGDLWYGWT